MSNPYGSDTTRTDAPRALPLPAFLFGFALMAVELSAARLLAPAFGTGADVWSAILAVAMGALAVGYRLGGRLADRHPTPALFYSVIAVSALLLGSATLTAEGVIEWSAALAVERGVVWGALTASAWLLLLPLTGLGFAAPYLLKFALPHAEVRAGGAAGTIYFAATLGSVAGSLGVGYLLLPHVGLVVAYRALAAALLIAAALTALRRAPLGGLYWPPSPVPPSCCWR